MILFYRSSTSVRQSCNTGDPRVRWPPFATAVARWWLSCRITLTRTCKLRRRCYRSCLWSQWLGPLRTRRCGATQWAHQAVVSQSSSETSGSLRLLRSRPPQVQADRLARNNETCSSLGTSGCKVSTPDDLVSWVTIGLENRIWFV